MKKASALAFAGLSVLGNAHAQSSVTLYGIIDESLAYTSNAGGGRVFTLASGVLQGSRWGLRATEDLGGGMKAIFVLENGFDVNAGTLKQGGAEWGRQAYVGLGTKYGTVTMGRQYDWVSIAVGPFEAGSQWAGFNAAHPGDLDNMNNTNRVNNSIKYTSQNYSGLVFGGMYSLGGVAGDVSRNQLYALGATYANGPLSLGAGYLYARDPNQSYFGTNPNASATNNNMTGSPVFSGFASADAERIAAAGGAYQIGAATVGVTYSYIEFSGLGGNPVGGSGPTNRYRGSTNFNSGEVNFKYQISPYLLVGLAYNYTKGSGVNDTGGATYHQGTVGVDYFLSKRTDLYAVASLQHASGVDSTGKSAVAAMNALSPSSTNQQTAIRLGIRHKF
ncbi:porin [Paraburkholderia sediminicola]|uniref:porin n=1 Tax=Paraburkholderia sediminicola TaxID=458836 RepID=UPI0038B92455